MKMTRWSCGAVLFMMMAMGTGSAIPPRQDINPALLYFQAFSALPSLDETESALLGHDTIGPVTDEERSLARRFDDAFKLLQRARGMKARCDWGTDIADGPHAFVPGPIKVRTAAHAAVLRARVALSDGKQKQARDELLAVSVLGHHAAAGGSLVVVMVQVAVDMKILDFIGAHFDEFTPETRRELAAGLNGIPQRQTVADAMASEQSGFADWLSAKLEEARAKERDDAKVLDQFRAIITDTFSDESDLADRMIEAAGGTSAGVLRYIRGTDAHYARAQTLARASAENIQRETAAFERAINSTTNLFARVAMPNVGRARMKELDLEARLNALPDRAP